MSNNDAEFDVVIAMLLEESSRLSQSLRHSVTVARGPLEPKVGVQIPVPQPNTTPRQ